MTDNEIIDKCLEFLKRSSEHYHTQIANQVRDLEAYNGLFWNEDLKKQYHRNNSRKLCLHFSDWSVIANAINSPYSNSPWHIELLSREGDNETVQDQINTIEQDNDYKSICKQSTLRQIVCGAGYAIVTTDIDQFTNEPKVLLEFVQRQDSVAFDPDVDTVDGSDAEEGAIVNYISINKAKRLYGEDVLPFDYPNSIPKMNFIGIDQWSNEVNKVQVVSYYRKNENRSVTYYKICGNKVIESIDLPIKYIPIIRFGGYEKYSNDGIYYSGIVDKTFSLQLGLNIAYSTLMERANRSIKANLIASTDAVENLETYYKKMSEDDGMMILYNKGTNAPTPLVESFQTGDLSQVIDQTRNLIADVIGVPLTGVLGNTDKTATEVLVQQTNSESNTAIFYDNAYKAMRTIGRIIVELLNSGKDVLFELENGPDVITNNLKRRSELQSVANLVPQNLQPIVAIHMLDTIDSNYSNQIKSDIIANLDSNIKLTTQTQDPNAIHQLKQLQTLLDQTMSELEQTKLENADLQKQYDTINLELMNRKQEQMIEFEKWQKEYELKVAELQGKSVLDTTIEQDKMSLEVAKLEQEKQKLQVQAAKDLL